MIDRGVKPAETPVIPDHALLVAAVAVRQAGTRTAQVAGRIALRERGPLDPVGALVATFLHADAVAAARALSGSFHPQVARTKRGVARSGSVNPGFTLAL